jgi:hypothetical protein
MMGLRSIPAAVVAALLCGCAGAMPTVQSASLPNGLYEFSERPSGAADAFTGRMRIFNDSIAMFSESPPCRQEQRANSRPEFSFTCGSYTFRADKDTGRWRFNYRTMRTDRYEVETCVAYVVRNGQRVCTQMNRQTKERQTPVNGNRRPIPVDTTGGPA